MNPKRVENKRKGKKGWQVRFTDPLTGNRTHKNIWFSEKREAELGFEAHLKIQGPSLLFHFKI